MHFFLSVRKIKFVFDFNWSKALVNMWYSLYTNLIFEKMQDVIKTVWVKWFFYRYVTKNWYVLVEDEINTLVPNPDEYKKAESWFEDTNIWFWMFFVSLRHILETSKWAFNLSKDDWHYLEVRSGVTGVVNEIISFKID